MATSPEYPFGSPVSVLKPNIPDCWTPELVKPVSVNQVQNNGG